METLQAESSEWTELGDLLTEDARIDLYGCSIGAGEDGSWFVQTLASVTDATVWASDDTTGNVEGSDWDLEVQTAADDREATMDFSILSDTPMALAVIDNPAGTTVTDLPGTSVADTISNEGTVTNDIDADAGNDSVTSSGSVGGSIYGGDGDDTITWDGGTVTGVIDGGADDDTLYLNVDAGDYHVRGRCLIGYADLRQRIRHMDEL